GYSSAASDVYKRQKKYSSRNTATLPWKVAAVFRRTVNKPATPPESQNTVSRNSLIGINDPA
ncbi:UNVERIFIED_CONTAM: hypothetical protein O1L25_03565, partial [Pseudomonas aeruginosa]